MSENCEKFAASLSAYFDGELEGKALLRLKGHLGHCESCPRELETYARIKEALISLAAQSGERTSMAGEIMDKVTPEKKTLPC